MSRAPRPAADHYRVLAVDPGADAASIRAAYLRLMRVAHPDLNPSDPAAAARAQQLNAAYAVLGSPTARARYDRLRVAGATATRNGHHRCAPARRSAGPAARAAYSRDQHDLREAFSSASLRLGTALFAAGAILLLALSLS